MIRVLHVIGSMGRGGSETMIMNLYRKINREKIQFDFMVHIIQNKENQALFTQSFTKIRKNHTTFLQPYDIAGQYHTGIFIDILPLDRIPDDKFSKLFFKWNLMNYLLFTREHVDARSNKLIRFFSSCLLRINSPTTRKRKRIKYLKSVLFHKHFYHYRD